MPLFLLLLAVGLAARWLVRRAITSAIRSAAWGTQ